MSDNLAANNQRYSFSSTYLNWYINLDEFKKAIAADEKLFKSTDSEKNFSSTLNSYSSLKQMYENFFFSEIMEKNIDSDRLSYLLFKEIDSRQLKNVFIDTVKKSSLKNFNIEDAISQINNKYNRNNKGVEDALCNLIGSSKHGYNRLAEMGKFESNKIACPCLFIFNNSLYFMFCAAVEVMDNLQTSIGTLSIDLETGLSLFKYRNNTKLTSNFDTSKINFINKGKRLQDQPNTFDANAAYKFVQGNIMSTAFKLEIDNHDTDKEQNVMYHINSELVEGLLSRPKDYLMKRTKNKELIRLQVEKALSVMRQLNVGESLKSDITDRIFDIY